MHIDMQDMHIDMQDIAYSFLSHTIGPCCLSVLRIVVCICQAQTPNLSHLLLSPLIAINLFLFWK